MDKSKTRHEMHSIRDKTHLWKLIKERSIVITPNNRLSGALLQEYYLSQQFEVLDKPFCLPYATAIVQAYQDCVFNQPQQQYPVLINQSQCLHLWRLILKSTRNITYSNGLLQAVTSAWKYCEQWQIKPDDPCFEYTPQTHQFQQWWQQFNHQLQQKKLIHEYQLIPYLIQLKTPIFSTDTIWVCFDEYTPQQYTLQTYLSSLGYNQHEYDLPEKNTHCELFSAKDSEEELLQLFRWIQLQLNEGKSPIGIVIPDLQQKFLSIKRTFQNHFNPELFNISLGQPLDQYPLVSHALTILKLQQNELTNQEATILLTSPYLGNAKEEFVMRSQYLQDSRTLLNPTISLDDLVKEIKNHTPKLSEQLQTIKSYPETGSPQEWILRFENRLNALHFPGDYGLDSENYQCFNRFITLFDEFRHLQNISPVLSQGEAFEAIQYLANTTIFQPQKSNAPIQICGLLEASGCEFKSLWVMELTDQCLPQKTRLSPFIPYPLQKQLLMPHSTPERELQFARQTINRLKNGSQAIVLSYPGIQGESPNLPCALVSHYPKYHPIEQAIENPLSISLLSEEENYRVPFAERELISGGTTVLANQAKCPFKAFADHRLSAKSIELGSDGIDNRERGQIHHKIMELLWKQLKSQQTLLQLSQEQLNQHIDQSIQEAIAPLNLSQLVQSIEYSRLKQIVIACLDWEKQRPAFMIEALEKSYSFQLGELTLNVRVDRLDQVGNKKWVIDYKSTLPSSKPWNEERPKEPQLLLYALLDEAINTLVFLQLKSGNINCSGLSAEKQDIQGISSIKKDETWIDNKSYWLQQLTQLADELMQGDCLPNPINQSICKECDFLNLCRFQDTE